MTNNSTLRRAFLANAIACALGVTASAQESESTQIDDSAIEEVVAIGRAISASQNVVEERINDASIVDTISAELISRLGDSTVAASLRRMPAVSLVQDKFVYIRGLGERYSATTVNGAKVPSPDLTRNVIPLDIFPTSIVESLRIQKAWSPEQSANFAGGSVDIRTRGVPNDFLFNFEISTGSNSETLGRVYTYDGGSDDGLGVDDGTRAMPADILSALQTYQGELDVQNILGSLRRQDPAATLADAQAINRSLGVALNRDFALQTQKSSPDGGIKLSIGNEFELNDNWSYGIQFGTSYETDWRHSEAFARNFRFPDERTDTERESTRSVDINSMFTTGLSFSTEQTLKISSIFLRNTDDETSVTDFFNENREVSDGLGFRDYRFQFEERELRTNQVEGSHRLGADTRESFAFLSRALGWLPVDTTIDWYVSESDAATSIPNELKVTAFTETDPVTSAVLSERIALQSTAADYRFTNLADDVRSRGWSATLPFSTDSSFIEVSVGGAYDDKARTYRQSQFSLGALSVTDAAALTGPIGQVFSDSNILSPLNDFVFARQGTNNQSYIAATMTDAMFGMVDWTLNDRWRLTGGARWEDYRQVAVDWNPYGYSLESPQVSTDPETLARGTFRDDRIYPAASVTYMGDVWAERFQLRFGFSETAIRPDLREITDASYVDPITGDLTNGNSGVIPSTVQNLDVRAEWFFDSGDNFTVSLFRKDILNPIEFFESAASDTTVAREIVNADSALVSGLEFEFLKQLGSSPFFLQGNLTLQDSELVAGPNADAPTNATRALAGASDYVANVMFGFDSANAKHTASVIFNVFGERHYVAGRNGAPDGYEQPFQSLDFTYSWYPRDTLTISAKMQNLLDEAIEIRRQGIVEFSERTGQAFAVAINWSF